MKKPKYWWFNWRFHTWNISSAPESVCVSRSEKLKTQDKEMFPQISVFFSYHTDVFLSSTSFKAFIWWQRNTSDIMTRWWQLTSVGVATLPSAIWLHVWREVQTGHFDWGQFDSDWRHLETKKWNIFLDWVGQLISTHQSSFQSLKIHKQATTEGGCSYSA